MSAVVASGAIVPLLNTLALPRDKPVMEAIKERRKLLEAATRALKAIFASSRSIKYDTFTVSSSFCVCVCLFCCCNTFYMCECRKNIFRTWFYYWTLHLVFFHVNHRVMSLVKGYRLL